MTSLIKEYWNLLQASKIVGDLVADVPLVTHDWGYSYDFNGYLTCCIVDNGDGTISEYADCLTPEEGFGPRVGTPQEVLADIERDLG